MGDRKIRKERIGVVTSNKMQNSIVVSEVRRVKHPKYGKFVLKTKKYVAHDEKNDCKLGDKVRITVIATGIDGMESLKIANQIVESDPNQVSFDLEQKIDNIDENISKTNDSNGNPDLDDLHPLGDDEHFEIPAFLRKNKK